MFVRYKIFYIVGFFMLLTHIGCSYKEPALHEPYGIVHPINLRITEINGERTVDITGRYIFRVKPGLNTIGMTYGNHETPAEGKKNNFTRMDINIEEGYRYYLQAKLIYGFEDFLFGLGFNAVQAWKPEIKHKERIPNYHTQPISSQ